MENLRLDVVMESFEYLMSQRNGCLCCLCVAGMERSAWQPPGAGDGFSWGIAGSAALLGCFTLWPGVPQGVL